jgi:hypothetical protein
MPWVHCLPLQGLQLAVAFRHRACVKAPAKQLCSPTNTDSPPCCRDAAKFQWEDGSPAPPLLPSNLAALEDITAGYSHWGVDEPGNQDPNKNEFCVAAMAWLRYHYFNGSTALDTKDEGAYITTWDRRNLRGFGDINCNGGAIAIIPENASTICESKGEQGTRSLSWLHTACRLSLTVGVWRRALPPQWGIALRTHPLPQLNASSLTGGM